MCAPCREKAKAGAYRSGRRTTLQHYMAAQIEEGDDIDVEALAVSPPLTSYMCTAESSLCMNSNGDSGQMQRCRLGVACCW